MANLRARVRELEEEELFEQTMLRGPRVTEEHPPSSDNLDVIMRSLMLPRQPAPPPAEPADLAMSWMQPISQGAMASSSVAGSRLAKGKGKSRLG